MWFRLKAGSSDDLGLAGADFGPLTTAIDRSVLKQWAGEMISDMAGSIDREVAPRQGRLQASADCWLSLAAAPTFATMALLTATFGHEAPDMLCTAAHGVSPLSGMASMYLLMSAFHSAPWLKLIARLRSGPRRASHTSL